MKYIKYVAVLLVVLGLAGCGGHGYEGHYVSTSDNKVFNAFSELAGVKKIYIGENFIEADGQRTQFDEIFVRELKSGDFLVFKSGNDEQTWEIDEDGTLVRDLGLMSLRFERVEK
ncbi:hypothetical protein AAEU32_11635 [Pseudoalteromonas sp. SSDWG2]|uniref:hypothetical protein n=1 Tax=Pseudoalteromonas sp. SSDWG2 TaxID=3139391 RepID=UPI003BA86B4B